MLYKKAPVVVVGIATALVILVIGGVAGFFIGGADSNTGDDVSEAGQVSYGCHLAKKMRDDNKNKNDWEEPGKGPAFSQALALAGLLGGGAPSVGPDSGNTEDTQLAVLGTQIYESLTRLDFAQFKSTLDDITDQCESR